MDKNTKVTIKDLIAKREAKKKKVLKTAEVYIESIGGNVTIQEPSEDKVRDMQTLMAYSRLAEEEVKENNEKVVFNHMIEPDLKDEELRKAYGVKATETYKIVDALFTPVEVLFLSSAILELSDIKFKDTVQLVEEIKN